MGSRAKASVPEWSRQVKAFRQSLKLSQAELGKRVGASTMAVSRWERGILDVPANLYIKLGNLAGDPLCWYFWGRAGLRSEDVMRVLPAARDRLHESRMASVFTVRAGNPSKQPVRQSDFVAVPLLPVYAATPGEQGDKDVDLEDGYIVAVDTADVLRDALMGKMVVAWNAEKGLLVSLLIRFDHTDALVSDHREYESVSLAPEFAWRIVGGVLWWIGWAR